MQHKHVIVRGVTLVNLMLEHMTDEEIAKALGVELRDEEHGPTVATPEGWWEVGWPEHVTSPKFNSDADYLGQVATHGDQLTPEQCSLIHHIDGRQVRAERWHAV